MGAMWQRLPQFSMLNPFLLLKQNAPQIDAFYVKVVFLTLFFDIMPSTWMLFV